jgi:hypothetical protein
MENLIGKKFTVMTDGVSTVCESNGTGIEGYIVLSYLENDCVEVQLIRTNRYMMCDDEVVKKEFKISEVLEHLS